MPRDQVFQLQDGWYCMVGGRKFGTWACREYAVAGMKTEQRRAAFKPVLTEPQWDEIIAEFCAA